MPIKILIKAINALIKDGELTESCPINDVTLKKIFAKAKELKNDSTSMHSQRH